tara:strand:- start:66 stop:281 length:216 start_codon:yes stop_codon:yes gene_type:complete
MNKENKEIKNLLRHKNIQHMHTRVLLAEAKQYIKTLEKQHSLLVKKVQKCEEQVYFYKHPRRSTRKKNKTK